VRAFTRLRKEIQLKVGFMSHAKKTKDSFKRDEQNRAILGSAKEMAEWVKLGFEEQDKSKTPDDESILKNYIDFRNCVLYISYPIGSKTHSTEVFNLSDMAGVVPGIEKIKGDPNYLYEVKMDIRFDGSVLYGNFFHYVRFNGAVSLDNVTIRGAFSGFKCRFDGYVYMQRLHIESRCDFEQCDFLKGLVMNGADADLFHFNNCTVMERFWLSSASLNNRQNDDYYQSIEITNSTIEHVNLSKVKTNGLPIYIGDSKVKVMRINTISLDNALCMSSCTLEGVMTMVKDENAPKNFIKEINLHICDVQAQCHIEDSDIERFIFSFGKIADRGRLRLSQCGIRQLSIGSSSVFGQVDIVENKIKSVDLEETHVPGYINFQSNEVEVFSNRQTLRMLKNEALKVNDDVEAIRMYAKEMESLLADNNVPCCEKLSLTINKWFSRFGVSWIQALLVTFGLSIALTLLMLGLGSSKYGFNPAGRFMGMGSFVTALLDNINVFSIPLFRDTINEYGLNAWGQIIYFVIKVIVAYGTYQFVVAFRKYGRK